MDSNSEQNKRINDLFVNGVPRMAFRLVHAGTGERFGDCECCHKPVDSSYHLTGGRVYWSVTKDEESLTSGDVSVFGHKDCLAAVTMRYVPTLPSPSADDALIPPRSQHAELLVRR